MLKRSRKPPRRVASIQELAEYFRVHRHTMRKLIGEYGELDFYDWTSIANLIRWMIRKGY